VEGSGSAVVAAPFAAKAFECYQHNTKPTTSIKCCLASTAGPPPNPSIAGPLLNPSAVGRTS
jgi:hypothetical protein